MWPRHGERVPRRCPGALLMWSFMQDLATLEASSQRRKMKPINTRWRLKNALRDSSYRWPGANDSNAAAELSWPAWVNESSYFLTANVSPLQNCISVGTLLIVAGEGLVPFSKQRMTVTLPRRSFYYHLGRVFVLVMKSPSEQAHLAWLTFYRCFKALADHNEVILIRSDGDNRIPIPDSRT